MPTVPKISSPQAELLRPLRLSVTVTPDDFAEAELRLLSPALRKRRRRILTTILPLFWFAILLIAFAFWKDANGTADTATLWRDLRRLPLMPIWTLLAVATALAGLLYATRPWRMHQRARRAIRRIGITKPGRHETVLDADGITVTEPDRSSMAPWNWVAEFAETSECFLFLLRYTGLPVVIPKRDLTSEQLAALPRYAALIGTEATAHQAAPPPDDAIDFAYRHTVEQQAELVLHNENRPQTRRDRWRGLAVIALGLLLVHPILLALYWILDPYRVPFADAWPLLVEHLARHAGYSLGIAVSIIAAFLLFRLAVLRSGARIQAAEVVAKRHHDDTRITITENGITTRQGNASGAFSWSNIEGVERTKNLLVFPIRHASRFIVIPHASLNAEQSKKLDDLIRSHLAAQKDAAA